MEKFQSELDKMEREKGELLADNQRMAELLAVSEGDSHEASHVMEKLTEERRSLQRQCKQLRDNGQSEQRVVGWGAPIPNSNFADSAVYILSIASHPNRLLKYDFVCKVLC